MKKLIAVAVIVVTLVLVFVSRNQLLHRGASNGESALIKFALAVGADKNAHAGDGSTPLTAAAAAGQTAAVHQLITAGADVDRRHRETGATALMEAAILGDSDMVDSLLAAGAAVSTRDNENHTAYWHAFDNTHYALARKVHYVREAKVKLAAGSSGSAGSIWESGGDTDAVEPEVASSGGGEIASTDESWESSRGTDRRIARASASAMPRLPAVPRLKSTPVDADLSAEEADEALVKAGQVVDWKKSARPGVVETQLTDKQQKIIDEAKRKKREEKKWELKDN